MLSTQRRGLRYNGECSYKIRLDKLSHSGWWYSIYTSLIFYNAFFTKYYVLCGPSPSPCLVVYIFSARWDNTNFLRFPVRGKKTRSPRPSIIRTMNKDQKAPWESEAFAEGWMVPDTWTVLNHTRQDARCLPPSKRQIGTSHIAIDLWVRVHALIAVTA